MGHIYTSRSHTELRGNVPVSRTKEEMFRTKEEMFPSTDSWANTIVGLWTSVSGLEFSSFSTKV